MRRSRRGGRSSMMEFGGSGEDSFVAVVVTKLTGALLFILLLTMVIMALIPRGAETATASAEAQKREPLEIATPERLPDAIVGRPYQVALAAKGGQGPLHWALSGPLPAGLEFDANSGQLRGQPRDGTPQPAALVARVSDGSHAASRTIALTVLQPDQPLTVPPRWKPSIPPLPWREWLRHGFGFLLLFLTYLVGMNALANLQNWASHRRRVAEDLTAQDRTRRRFARYRWTVRLAAAGMMAGLAVWLWRSP